MLKVERKNLGYSQNKQSPENIESQKGIKCCNHICDSHYINSKFNVLIMDGYKRGKGAQCFCIDMSRDCYHCIHFCLFYFQSLNWVQVEFGLVNRKENRETCIEV
jgi:hypothetical protein